MSFRKVLALGVAGAALAAAMPAFAQSNSPSTPRTLGYPATGGVEVGRGWISQDVQAALSTCIIFDTANSQEGQEVTAERTLVTDKSSYSDALNISADVQVKSATGAEVDAKASYASKKEISSTYMTVVDMVTVNNGWTYAAPKAAGSSLQAGAPPGALAAGRPAQNQSALDIHRKYASYFQNVPHQRTVKDKNHAFAIALQRMYLDAGQAGKAAASSAIQTFRGAAPPPPPPHLRGMAAPAGGLLGDSQNATVRLTDAAVKLIETNPDQFQKECGDSFISAIQKGGELAVTYTFLTTSQSEQQEIGASLGVSYGTPVASGSATVSVSDALSKSSSKTSTSITYYKTGGKGDPIPTSLDAIDGVTSGFAASVAKDPYAYQITVTDYRALPNYPTGKPGMPELTGFQKLAWEYGKAQTLFSSASQIIADFGDEQTKRNYLSTRWGYTIDDVNTVQRNAGSRMQAVNTVARACLKSSAADSDRVCNIATFDDLAPRATFPLPISAGNVGEVMSAMWGDDGIYQQAVFGRWISQVNDNRCYSHPGDSLFCKYAADLTGLRNGIRAGKPGVMAFEFVDRPGQCYAHGGSNAFASQQPCPDVRNTDGFMLRYDPGTKRLHPAGQPGNCVLAVRVRLAVTAGYAATGVGSCEAQNAGDDITRTWSFRDSTDKNGRPDNTGVYMVVADRGSPQFNSCLDSASNSSAWVAPCTHPMRLRLWMVAPGN